ncbi:MAG: hypothetical protein JWL97_4460 [Gemmatimonadales bacterium]|jgi:hypothetical protein|nr:hypothetical protein [Gemmatimonadales bacterium]
MVAVDGAVLGAVFGVAWWLGRRGPAKSLDLVIERFLAEVARLHEELDAARDADRRLTALHGRCADLADQWQALWPTPGIHTRFTRELRQLLDDSAKEAKR